MGLLGRNDGPYAIIIGIRKLLIIWHLQICIEGEGVRSLQNVKISRKKQSVSVGGIIGR